MTRHLPTLRPGINILDSRSRTTGALQSLVLNQLFTVGGEAVWVDARDNASTTIMNRITPRSDVLDRVQVARAFTPFQHLSIVEDVEDAVTENTALLVLPDVDYCYRQDELLEDEGWAMLNAGLEQLEAVTDQHQIPALITADAFPSLISRYVDHRIRCRITEQGPRFETDDFQTLLYVGNGYVQTTLDLWRVILQERVETLQPVPTGVEEVG